MEDNRIIVCEVPEFRRAHSDETQAHHAMIDLQYDLCDIECGMQRSELESRMKGMANKRRARVWKTLRFRKDDNMSRIQPTESILALRTRQITETREQLVGMPDCRNKSLALTNLDNAEVVLESNQHLTEEEMADESYRFLILAFGYWERARRGPG